MARDAAVGIAAGIACLLLLVAAGAAHGDCSLVNVSPVADFQYAVVPSETAPIAVNFYSLSKGGRAGSGPVSDPIDTILWTFGDGTSGEEDNPLHTYASGSARYGGTPRPFSVTLMLRTVCGRSAAVTKEIPVYCLNQSPGFDIGPPPGDKPYAAPVALSITDASLHAPGAVTTWHYTVWDAGMTRLYLESTEKDPTFVIRNGGSYIIRQEVFKACSSIPQPGAVVEKTIEVTGSAASDALPMDTIPVTPAGGAAAPPAATRTTVPAPAAAAVSPATGDLSIVTNPAGAQVFVDDFPYGTSPATVTDLEAGNHTVRLEKQGYRKTTVIVDVDRGVVSEYPITLEPEKAGISMATIGTIAAAVVVLLAAAGIAYWFFVLRKKPRKPHYHDGNALFLVDDSQ